MFFVVFFKRQIAIYPLATNFQNRQQTSTSFYKASENAQTRSWATSLGLMNMIYVFSNRIAENFWSLANSKLNCIWWRKLLRIKAKPLAFSDITSNWRIKLWHIHSKSPNLPKFSAMLYIWATELDSYCLMLLSCYKTFWIWKMTTGPHESSTITQALTQQWWKPLVAQLIKEATWGTERYS